MHLLLICLWSWQGKTGMAMYSQFEKDRDQGNFELLPELHAILSGMKVHLHCHVLPWVAPLPLTILTHMSIPVCITVTLHFTVA